MVRWPLSLSFNAGTPEGFCKSMLSIRSPKETSQMSAKVSCFACACFVMLALISPGNSFADEGSEACASALSDALTMNATELWAAANKCAEGSDVDGATYLMLVGQIRAMTDMGVLEAATDQDEVTVAELYGTLYYSMGGSGYDEIYRDENRTNDLFAAVREWNPQLDGTYNPGWAYRAITDSALYAQTIQCQKALRLQRLDWYAGLIRIDDYYAASRELDELRAANPKLIVVGSDVEKRMTEIRARMAKARAGREMPTELPEECDFATVYEPDRDAEYEHVHVGSNGPVHSASTVFESRDAVRRSWLASSLTPSELNAILGRMDFGTHILVALSFGRRTNATGKIYFSNIDYNSVMDTLSIAGMIGVQGRDCDEPPSEAYPFVVAIAPRPSNVPDYTGYFAQNFPDDCKPAMTGSAVSSEGQQWPSLPR